MASHRPLLDLWLAAIQEPLGLYIKTPDLNRLRMSLHSAREAAIPEVKQALRGLVLRTSPRDPEHELWIVKDTGRSVQPSMPQIVDDTLPTAESDAKGLDL